MSTETETLGRHSGLGHLRINPSVLYVGTPVALVTSISPDGTTNISPMSSAWALGDRVVLGMGSTGQGCENVLRDGELVINFPSPDLWPGVEAIARLTGRRDVPPDKVGIGYEYAADKFGPAGFTPQDSEIVRPPRIAECPIQFEAKVVAAHDAGSDRSTDQPASFQIIEARVLRVHAQRRIVIPGTNHIDTAAWSPLLYVFRHYFGVGPDLGRTFKAEI